MKFFVAIFAAIIAVCSASGYYGGAYLAAPAYTKVIAAPVPTSVTSRVDTYGLVARPVAVAPVVYGHGVYGHGLGHGVYGVGHGVYGLGKAYY